MVSKQVNEIQRPPGFQRHYAFTAKQVLFERSYTKPCNGETVAHESRQSQLPPRGKFPWYTRVLETVGVSPPNKGPSIM